MEAVMAFLQRLSSNDFLVADGATGTNLQEMGLQAGEHTEDWIIDHPDRILELEKAFVEAGANIILTCTFGGTPICMKGSRYSDRVEDINRRAALLAREAAGTRPGILVGGSMGPIGQLLKPYGPIEYEQAVSAYAEQAHGLAAGEVDLLVIETQFSLDEAKAALQGARAVTDLPAVVSFSYDRGTRTIMGVTPKAAATTFASLGAAMIGVNCGTTLGDAQTVLQEYASAAPSLPLWAKPNAGLPRMDATKAIYDVSPEQMAGFARTAVALGARVVGGCCGTTPLHVRAIANAIQALKTNPTP
jgi:5-methyltetrahydrofolate--homocysteine methyltransferase